MRITALEIYKIEKIAAGSHSAAVSSKGELFLWGRGDFGDFLLPQHIYLDRRIVNVSIGYSFGCSIDEKQQLYSWGTNQSGELGVGDFDRRGKPTLISYLKNKRVNSVACGGEFAIALGKTVSKAE